MTAILISSWFVRRHSASVMNALVLAAAGLADPAEIGAVAAFLASSDSSFMTVSEVAVVSGSVRRAFTSNPPTHTVAPQAAIRHCHLRPKNLSKNAS